MGTIIIIIIIIIIISFHFMMPFCPDKTMFVLLYLLCFIFHMFIFVVSYITIFYYVSVLSV